MPRTVAVNSGLPTSGSRHTTSGFAMAPSRMDHVHPMWSVWRNWPLSGTWQNVPDPVQPGFQMCEASSLVMIRGTVRNPSPNPATSVIADFSGTQYPPRESLAFMVYADLNPGGIEIYVLEVTSDGPIQLLTRTWVPIAVNTEILYIPNVFWRFDV